MALLSNLVTAIAKSEGLDETYVAGVARYLREAGLITQAGRGRGAAHMSRADAAHLLIGVNASPIAKSSPEVVRLFSEMRLIKNEVYSTEEEWLSTLNDDDPVDQSLRKGELLRSTLCTLIAAYIPNDTGRCAGDRMAEVYIRFERPHLSCWIELADYSSPDDAEVYHQVIFETDAAIGIDTGSMPDRVETVMITQRTLRAIGLVLAD